MVFVLKLIAQVLGFSKWSNTVKKKKLHDPSHDALFIVCRCQNSNDDCQPGLITKIYE